MSATLSSPWNQAPHQAPEDRWDAIPPWLRALDRKPFWIVLMILGFIHWWPIGLALLIFLIGSGRMGCGFRRYHGGGRRGWAQWCQSGPAEERQPGSGNRAFDEYRAETLRRLEEEQREFGAFLDRLRFARDKAEFDEFMAQRRQPPAGPAQPEQV